MYWADVALLTFSLAFDCFFLSCDDYSFAVSCVPENNFFPPSWRVFIIFTHNRGERNEKNSTVDRRIFFWFSHFFLFFLLSAFFLSHHENLIFFRKSFTFFMFQQLRWHEKLITVLYLQKKNFSLSLQLLYTP